MAVRMSTVRVAAKLSPGQHRRLDEILGWSAEMYNALLESWRGTYRWWREHNPGDDQTFPKELNRSRNDLCMMFTQVRREDARWDGLDTRVGRGVICRFDRTIRAFYDRCKKQKKDGKKPGFPRFKPRHRFRSIVIVDPSLSMLKPPPGDGRWWRLKVNGVPSVRFADRGGRLRSHLDEGKLVEIRLVRTALRVEIHAVFRLPAPEIPASGAVEPGRNRHGPKEPSYPVRRQPCGSPPARPSHLFVDSNAGWPALKKAHAPGLKNGRRWLKRIVGKQNVLGRRISVSPTS